ncbi:MAG TPA: GAF domain-containing protein [Streptosporangiaceae bacterium]|nr:GAF domain-containing protein [Streptosporangiaceae bacterium]
MRSVASQLGMSSSLAALGHKTGAIAVVAASDETARVAHDLELVMAEGPATDAARGAPVRAAGQALLDRWPRYGPAVAELGVQAVCAAPLRSRSRGIGVLCGYDRMPAISQQNLTATEVIADVLTEALLGMIDLTSQKDSFSLAFLDESDCQSVVHQAAGMLSVQCECQVEDAADLLAAQAFADGKPVQEIALGIVQGRELRENG